MYAIRSYYASIISRIFASPRSVAFVQPSALSWAKIAPEIVITSYSIHYTKLYENSPVFVPPALMLTADWGNPASCRAAVRRDREDSYNFV